MSETQAQPQSQSQLRIPVQPMLSELLDKIKSSASVEVVYGESRTIGDTTIIPIAVVAYVFGAGGGSGEGPAPGGERMAGGGGGGGGGRVRVQPVALLRVMEGSTRLVPILDWTRIITTAITFLGLWLVIRALRNRR